MELEKLFALIGILVVGFLIFGCIEKKLQTLGTERYNQTISMKEGLATVESTRCFYTLGGGVLQRDMYGIGHWSGNCNMCICTKEGIVCSDANCAEVNNEPQFPEIVRCEYSEGYTFFPGEILYLPDGCNKCECTDAGVMECTELSCTSQ